MAKVDWHPGELYPRVGLDPLRGSCVTFLAPDIVEAILDGYQPADLELERLMKGIPVGWNEQRRALGFSRG